jgi:Tol biopolymer transport system component
VSAEGGARVQIISARNSDERFPKINPKKPQMIAFASNYEGKEWDIFIVEDFIKDPNTWCPVTEKGFDDICPSWSPDGKKIVYCSSPVGKEQWMLKIYDLDLDKTIILDVDGFLPQWAPAGNRIVFQRLRRTGQRFSSIWALEYEDGMVKNVAEIVGTDRWAAINPAWSKDAQKIAFASVAKSAEKKYVFKKADELFLTDPEGKKIIQITHTPYSESQPCFSPDGRLFFVSDRQSKGDIYSIKLE